MYVVEITFECFADTTILAVERGINGLMDVFRYNGQVLGREFPVVMGEGVFHVRAVCPEKDSLMPKNHSIEVKACIATLSKAGLLSPKIKAIGADLNSEQTALEDQSNWQVLYTTYLHTCSPLRCGKTLLPIPLYRLPCLSNNGHQAVIKWQTQWQACDEIQMSGPGKTEQATLCEIQDIDSALFCKGMEIRQEIESLTKIPTYYYQYRVGGVDAKSERERRCPRCGGSWALSTPLHEIFHFKCDACRLISNLSWDFQ